jgi:hypothetical protein
MQVVILKMENNTLYYLDTTKIVGLCVNSDQTINVLTTDGTFSCNNPVSDFASVFTVVNPNT